MTGEARKVLFKDSFLEIAIDPKIPITEAFAKIQAKRLKIEVKNVLEYFNVANSALSGLFDMSAERDRMEEPRENSAEQNSEPDS